MAVLLEEHPLQGLCAAPAVVRLKLCALAQIPQDRIRLGQEAAVVQLEQGNPAVGVLGQEFGLAGFFRHQRIFLQLQGDAELAGGEPHLVAIARHLHLVKCEH